ncbi:MAG TPA: hypothetical protein PKY96_14350, partial [Flavobacteriales bacterium]|nr:hypothetical protein [Flavobacteriales bacterium]
GVLDLARPDAERIYAGKESSRHSVPQKELNQLLVRLARTGRKVVRSKAADRPGGGVDSQRLPRSCSCRA